LPAQERDNDLNVRRAKKEIPMATNDMTAGLADGDNQFVARVKAALCKACPAVQNESAGTANHAVRLALVGRILQNPTGYAQRFAVYVAVDSTVAAQSTLAAATDAQIETATNSLLDMFSLQNA
jgi:hypothetical protein